MTASQAHLHRIAMTVSERVDRLDPRARGDLELAVTVLERTADQLDGWARGTTAERLDAARSAPDVVLERRLANAHLRLGVADRRGQLSPESAARIAELSDLLLDVATVPARAPASVGASVAPAVAC